MAGTEEDAGGSCTVPHSFTGGTRVLMADGMSKPISQVQAGDEVEDSVPGQKGTETHTVSKVIVTHTDHDFAKLTIAPVKAGAAGAVKNTAKRAGSVLGSAAKALKSKAKLGLAAATAVGAVAAGGQPAMAGTAPAHGGTITTTFRHPFYDQTQAAFVEAQHLHAGDVLQTPTGTAKVTALRLFHADTVTYDLTIGTLHTYYVVAGTTPVLVHNIDGCGTGQSRGPDGRFRSDPNASTPDARYARVKLRSSTKEATQDAAPRDEDGNFIDPNTGESIPQGGPFHYGHKPGYEYWRNRDMAQAADWTRDQFVEFENDSSHYQIEDPITI